MDGEAGWWTTCGNIGLPPLARVLGVGRQQQQERDNEHNILQSIQANVRSLVIELTASIDDSSILKLQVQRLSDGLNDSDNRLSRIQDELTQYIDLNSSLREHNKHIKEHLQLETKTESERLSINNVFLRFPNLYLNNTNIHILVFNDN